MDIESFKHSFDTLLLSELDKLLIRTKNRIHNPHIDALLSHVYELAKNGKRVRPYVLSLAYGANSFEDTIEIRNQLVGIELLHLFALIHDDIMDEALTRHGVDSINFFSESRYENSANKNLQGKYEAILVGDLVFSFAYELFAKDQDFDVLRVFHELVDEVITGQLIDIRIPFEENVTKEMIKERMLFKTARYSFARPMQIGALLAKKSTDEIETLFSLGEELGIIYQITDDIIDVKGSAKDIHKTPLQDLFNGQETILTFYIKEHCDKAIVEKLNSLSRRSLNSQEVTLAQELFDSSGALSYAQEEIESHSLNAHKYILNSELMHKDHWRALLNKLISRTS